MTANPTDDREREIRERRAKITPPPWMWSGGGLSWHPSDMSTSEMVLWPANHIEPEVPLDKDNYQQFWREQLGACGSRTEDDAPFNADFIAKAPEDIDYLLSLIDSLRTTANSAYELGYKNGRESVPEHEY